MPHQSPVDDRLIDHLAELARIQVPAERRDELRTHLARIVASFSALAEARLDPDGEPATEAATPAARSATSLRADEAGPAGSPDDVLANAPHKAADCFVVPRVVDA